MSNVPAPDRRDAWPGRAFVREADPPPPVLQRVMHWHGRVTGSWWAVVPGPEGPVLVEAASRDALAAVVHRHLRRPM